jgi:1-deoxy-D-xylulose 5-phosphate reductoisomerase
MKKKVCILGSTGSIGVSTLNILSNDKKNFEVILLSANKNYKLLLKQAKVFKQKYNSFQQVKKISPRPMYNILKSSEYGVEWAVSKKAPNPNGIHSGPGCAKTRLNSNIIAPHVLFVIF